MIEEVTRIPTSNSSSDTTRAISIENRTTKKAKEICDEIVNIEKSTDFLKKKTIFQKQKANLKKLRDELSDRGEAECIPGVERNNLRNWTKDSGILRMNMKVKGAKAFIEVTSNSKKNHQPQEVQQIQLIDTSFISLHKVYSERSRKIQ